MRLVPNKKSPSQTQEIIESDHFSNGRFHNTQPRPKTCSSNIFRLLWNFYFNKPDDCVPNLPIPIVPITIEDLNTAPDPCLYRLGHSTVLIKVNGEFWLTDPVFSKRASPFSFMGPKRFHEPPVALENLPQLAGVILSHNHYDHLDRKAVRALAQKAERFITPLGVGDILIRWGIAPTKIQQLDWWQNTQIGQLKLVATPAQHFSGRTPWDSNQTLWCSWVIETQSFKLFFSGDSGYFDGFKSIGERYGPFDITLMETGAYNHQWTFVHMKPEESLQAHLDLQGRWLLPIHNGTFDLAMHAWYDPFERIEKLAKRNNVALATPKIGEAVAILAPNRGTRWWRSIMPQTSLATADSVQRQI